jgi:NTP pyrophosphatase (non-canonical NTP hydrolase)
MNFDEYQNLSRETAIYPDRGNNFIYPTLGLAGEAGEVAEKVKKVIRDKNGVMGQESKDYISKELGDVLWYVAQIATELDLSLEEIAKANIAKLQSRKERGSLSGSGDMR